MPNKEHLLQQLNSMYDDYVIERRTVTEDAVNAYQKLLHSFFAVSGDRCLEDFDLEGYSSDFRKRPRQSQIDYMKDSMTGTMASLQRLWIYMKRPDASPTVPSGRTNFYAMSDHELRLICEQCGINPNYPPEAKKWSYSVERPRVLRELLEFESRHTQGSQVNQFHGPVTGSVIQQGSFNTGTVHNTANDIRAVLEEIQPLLTDVRLNESDRNEIKVNYDTVETQLKSAAPKGGIINACLEGVKDIAAKALGSGIAEVATPLLIAYLKAHGL